MIDESALRLACGHDHSLVTSFKSLGWTAKTILLLVLHACSAHILNYHLLAVRKSSVSCELKYC